MDTSSSRLPASSFRRQGQRAFDQGEVMLQSAFGLATGIAVYAGPRWLPKAEFHRLESR